MKLRTLATLLIVAVLAMSATARPTRQELTASPAPLFVIAINPIFPGGAIITKTIQQAHATSIAWAGLDPVCAAVPSVCEIRNSDTVYYLVYSGYTIVEN